MRLFAISDLHLSYGVDKPMDIFGEHWRGHGERIAASWDARIGADDWVLVGGDTSWGLTLEEARPDLDWLGARPGRKVLIKGNHCTWWSSITKLKKVLHPSVHPMQNDAVALGDGTVVVGARLWDPPGSPWADEGAQKIFDRELGRLAMSIEAGKKLGGDRLIALCHYPPRYSDGRVTPAATMIEAAGASMCIYGHLHGRDHKWGFQGLSNGVRYLLVSCDAVGFEPIELIR